MSACTPAASSPTPTVSPTPSESVRRPSSTVLSRSSASRATISSTRKNCRRSSARASLRSRSSTRPIVCSTVTPDDAARDQIGSLVCDWNDGQEPASPWGPPPDPRQSVRLSLVADAEEAAQRYVDTYASVEVDTPYGPTAQGPRCIGIDDAMAVRILRAARLALECLDRLHRARVSSPTGTRPTPSCSTPS